MRVVLKHAVTGKVTRQLKIQPCLFVVLVQCLSTVDVFDGTAAFARVTDAVGVLTVRRSDDKYETTGWARRFNSVVDARVQGGVI